MRAQFKYGIGSFSGTIDDMVFRPVKSKSGSYVRKYASPKLSEQHLNFGKISKNLISLYYSCSPSYISDLKLYTIRYFNQIKHSSGFDVSHSSFSVFTKILWALKRKYPDDIDLSDIDLRFIYNHDLPCLSILYSINAGLLPRVNPCQDLICQM